MNNIKLGYNLGELLNNFLINANKYSLCCLKKLNDVNGKNIYKLCEIDNLSTKGKDMLNEFSKVNPDFYPNDKEGEPLISSLNEGELFQFYLCRNGKNKQRFLGFTQPSKSNEDALLTIFHLLYVDWNHEMFGSKKDQVQQWFSCDSKNYQCFH